MSNPKTIILSALLLLASCASFSSQMQTDSIETTTEAVARRHNSYVKQDTSLDSSDQMRFLQEGNDLSNLVNLQDEVDRVQFSLVAAPVLHRHDEYVESDETLIDLERRTYLRSSEILWDLAGLEER